MLRPEQAVALFVGAFVLFAAAGQLLPHTSFGMVVGQIAFFALPAIVILRWRGVPLRSGLGLRRPGAGAFVGAAMIGVSFWYLGLWITIGILGDYATNPAGLEELERQVAWSGDTLAIRLVAVALVPAVCEELLMRGVLARSLRPSLGIAGAVVLSALLFASLHLPAVRMIPAALIGVALGYAAVATNSVYPAMLMHFLNNLVAAVLIPGIPSIGETIDAYPVATGVAAAALTACGGALLWRSRVSQPQ